MPIVKPNPIINLPAKKLPYLHTTVLSVFQDVDLTGSNELTMRLLAAARSILRFDSRFHNATSHKQPSKDYLALLEDKQNRDAFLLANWNDCLDMVS
jgi:hypothetical protein